jgi:hypothetical protein
MKVTKGRGMWDFLILKDRVPSRPRLKGLRHFRALLSPAAQMGRRSDSWIRCVKNINASAIFCDAVTSTSSLSVV